MSGTNSVRLASAGDSSGLAAVYAPYVLSTSISFETTPPTPAEMERRLALVLARSVWLVCELEGNVAGYAYLSPHHERAAYGWSVDSAVYVAEAERGRGIGRALYTTLFELARLQGYCAVHAGITLPNAASVGLHESFGFRPVGVYEKVGYKRGAWHDVGWWQLELRERRGAPAPVIAPERLTSERPEECARAFAAGSVLLSRPTRTRT